MAIAAWKRLEDACRDAAVEVPAFTLGSIVRRLGHEHIDLLQMDIEGAEYEVPDNLLESAVKPHQLLVESPRYRPSQNARLRDDGCRIFANS